MATRRFENTIAAERLQDKKAQNLKQAWTIWNATDPISAFLRVMGTTIAAQSLTLAMMATGFWIPVMAGTLLIMALTIAWTAQRYGRSFELGVTVSAILMGALFAAIGMVI